MAAPPPHTPDLRALGVSGNRPLALIDVDEVLGLFLKGFGAFLEGRGLEFRLDRFALFQNIYAPGADQHMEIAEGRRHYDDFFATGCHEIEPAPGAIAALTRLARRCDIVILTNAPASAEALRGRWLARHGLPYPLVLNTGPKGPIAAAMVAQVAHPAAFVDDLIPNLDSVAEHAPAVARFQHVADERLRPLAPTAPDRHPRIDDWDELRAAIEQAILR